MDSPGSVPRFSGEFWLSPLAVHRAPAGARHAGGGIRRRRGASKACRPACSRIDVIELEPKVIDANRATASLRKRDPLTDSRVNIIVNDARGALRLTDHRYDAIVSQPSHPWTAGASHLYTREFMQLAHDHLTPQWRVRAVDERDLHGRGTAALADRHPARACTANVRVYRPDPNTLVFLASDGRSTSRQQLAATGLPLRDAPLHYARFGINNTEDLVAALVLDTDGARRLSQRRAADHRRRQPHRDLECLRAGSRHERRDQRPVLAGYDPLQRADSLVYGTCASSFRFRTWSRRNGIFVLLDPSLTDRAARMAQILGNSADGEYARAFYFRMQRQAQRSTELLRLADRSIPGRSAAAPGIPARLLRGAGPATRLRPK